MHFFDTYDFFNFNFFNINFSAIFDKNFVYDNWVRRSQAIPHFHETWEIYFVKSGKVLIDCQHKIVSITAGQSILIPPDTEHFITDTASDTSFGSIRFCFSVIEDYNVNIPINRSFQKYSLVPFDCKCSMKNEFDLLRQLYTEYFENQDKKFWLYPKITAQSMVFFSSIIETLSKAELNVVESDPNTAKDISPMIIEFFIMYAADDSITINDLAKNLNYSVSQTNRILHQKFGKSFRALMKDTRIKKAKYYLTRTDFSIQKISEILGYAESKNFNRSFKESVGVTPTIYRKNNIGLLL